MTTEERDILHRKMGADTFRQLEEAIVLTGRRKNWCLAVAGSAYAAAIIAIAEFWF